MFESLYTGAVDAFQILEPTPSDSDASWGVGLGSGTCVFTSTLGFLLQESLCHILRSTVLGVFRKAVSY